MNKQKLYPDSGIELNPFIAKYYDAVMNFATLGFYSSFISKAVKNMGIKPDDAILDLGCGSGRNAKLMTSYLGSNGRITGLDISEDMQTSFLSKFNSDHLAEFVNQRIDIDFDLNHKYDIVFLSFVIHGFPHEVRKTIIRNASKHLKPGGRFIILDFAKFNMDEMPGFHRWIFKKIECKYAFDFIERNWAEILQDYGFHDAKEFLFMKKYVRLLTTTKP